MTFREKIESEKDIEELRYLFLQYHDNTMGFDAFLQEKLGNEYTKLSIKYAKQRMMFELREMVKKEA